MATVCCRAAALGLTADEIIKVDEFTENLRATGGRGGGMSSADYSMFRLPSSPRKQPRDMVDHSMHSSYREDQVIRVDTYRVESSFEQNEKKVKRSNSTSFRNGWMVPKFIRILKLETASPNRTYFA